MSNLHCCYSWPARVAPQHAVADFVAHLHEVGFCTISLELGEAVLRKSIDRIGKCLVAGVAFPARRDVLIGGVGPTVGVMEIDHQFHAGILDALAQFLHVGEVLHNARL